VDDFDVIQCKTADEYIRELSLSNNSWWSDNLDCSWIFRGQNSSASLIPSLYRKTDNSSAELVYKKIFDALHDKLIDTPDLSGAIDLMVQNLKLGDQEKIRMSEIIKASFVEIFSIDNFLASSNDIRLYTSR
jgi:hypothetical protein